LLSSVRPFFRDAVIVVNRDHPLQSTCHGEAQRGPKFTHVGCK
jgi:hypothetical protein